MWNSSKRSQNRFFRWTRYFFGEIDAFRSKPVILRSKRYFLQSRSLCYIIYVHFHNFNFQSYQIFEMPKIPELNLVIPPRFIFRTKKSEFSSKNLITHCCRFLIKNLEMVEVWQLVSEGDGLLSLLRQSAMDQEWTEFSKFMNKLPLIGGNVSFAATCSVLK